MCSGLTLIQLQKVAKSQPSMAVKQTALVAANVTGLVLPVPICAAACVKTNLDLYQ